MNKQFKADLEVGQKYEVLAQEKIIKYYGNIYEVVEVCDDFKYDFMLSNDMTYEVKFERCSLKTNNVFIEFIAFNKISGIQQTKADYYIIVLPVNAIENQFVLIEVEVLKTLISKKKYSRIHTDKFKSGYIFPKNIIISYGIIINNKSI